jgi:murein DD-endopeptidase MepM/ murein hydrolase activator NlpD
MAPSFAFAGQSLQKKIAAERAKAEQIAQRLHQKRLELNAATVKVGDLQGQLNQTNSAISNVTARIGDLGTQEHSTQSRLNWNTIQLDAAEKSLHLHDGLLKQRLVAIYENGDLEYVNVLLTARTFSEFVERWEDLRLLIASNQRAVHDRKSAERKVASVQANLQSTQIALAQQQAEQGRARAQLSGLADERRNLVSLADAQRRGVAGQVAQIEDLSAAEEARLEALIRERQRELEAQRAAQRRAAGIAGVIPPPNEGSPSSLVWPVSGPITSPFGYRRNPFGGAPDFHPGLDIGVSTGTTVVAAASGTVIMAQWYGGYGNYILIDHGGGISTGYGHLSAFYVSTGQQVQRGQAIAASGSTGASTGPHLHFEVRKNGKPIDPSPWLH